MAAPSDWLITPRQVWAHVPGELQRRTIELMAHLAMNLVVAVNTELNEEAADAEARSDTQAPA
jgi:hypothetical protein